MPEHDAKEIFRPDTGWRSRAEAGQCRRSFEGPGVVKANYQKLKLSQIIRVNRLVG